MDFLLKLNTAQATELALAAELWCRIGTGDITALLYHPAIQKRLVTDEGVTTEDVRRLLLGLKHTVFGLSETEGMSILSPEVNQGTKRMFDIMQVVRHELAVRNHPHSLRAQTPIRQVSTDPLPTMREKTNDPV